jgi:hypothetical protein
MGAGLHLESVRLHPVDVENVVRRCMHDRLGGRLVSVAHALEELRIETGDFISPDRELADALAAKALLLGYAVLLDEEPGAGITV